MKNPVPLEVSDIAILEKTLINLINTFPELPPEISCILFHQLKQNQISMCLCSVPGGSIKHKTYISGAYLGRYNFKIIFQKMSVTNNERINAHDTLGKIGAWLERTPIKRENGEIYQLKEYPPLDEMRKIREIKRIYFPKLVERLQPNVEISEANFHLEFEVKSNIF